MRQAVRATALGVRARLGVRLVSAPSAARPDGQGSGHGHGAAGRAGGGAGGNPSGRHRRARCRTPPHRTGVARRHPGAAGLPVPADRPGEAGVRPGSDGGAQDAGRRAGPGRRGADRTAPGGAWHASAGPHRPWPGRGGTGARREQRARCHRAVGRSGGRDTSASTAVEAAAYFVVAEALANVARHSGADRAETRLARTPSGLWVSVRDEGRGDAETVAGASGAGETGGADSSEGGSGLLGIRRRVAALDGTVTVTSPRGGPTDVTVELPCRWRSPGARVAAATTTGRTPRSGRAAGSGR